MQGEAPLQAEIVANGVEGDRDWAVWDLRDGQLTGGKRLPKLMSCRAWFEKGASDVWVQVPGSDPLPPHEVAVPLSRFLGREVQLVQRRPAEELRHYRAARLVSPRRLRADLGVEPGEPLPDLTSLPLAKLVQLSGFVTPPGSYCDAYPLHILTTASLAHARGQLPDFQAQRFRPNVLIDCEAAEPGLVENEWCGGELHFTSRGTSGAAPGAVLYIEARTVRCSMVMRAQGELPENREVLRNVTRNADRHLGVYATVRKPGRISVGDLVSYYPSDHRPGWLQSTGASLKRALFQGAARTVFRG